MSGVRDTLQQFRAQPGKHPGRQFLVHHPHKFGNAQVIAANLRQHLAHQVIHHALHRGQYDFHLVTVLLHLVAVLRRGGVRMLRHPGFKGLRRQWTTDQVALGGVALPTPEQLQAALELDPFSYDL